LAPWARSPESLHLNFGFPGNECHRAISDPLIQVSIANILVVDDDIAIRILHRMLSEEHYKFETRQFVADALVAIEQTAFDVFVIDYKLPDGSGLNVAERIRSQGNEAPIILISGYDTSSVALRAEKLGIFDFLQKPFSRETVCALVKKAIGSSKAAKAALELSPGDPPFSPIMSGA